MEAFFRAFWGGEISFAHPQLWRTKGQVLQMLRREHLESGYERTRSCSRGPRDLRSGLECGVCSGCLLRRLATFSADVGESNDRYLWSNLRAPSIEKSLRADSSRPVSINDRDIAVHAVLAMEGLARQAELSSSSTAHQESLFDAFGHQPNKFKESGSKLAQLLSEHQREWRAFTTELGPDSWVNQQIAVLP